MQYTGIVGNIDGISITAGLAQILEFYKRYGGYDYLISEL